jgi:hypothetical protein
LLGKIPDKKLAKRFGRSRNAVQAHRISIGLRKYRLKFRPWTEKEESLLGTATDAQIGAIIGREAATIAAHRHLRGIPRAPYVPYNGWTPKEDRFLGKLEDAEVARRLNRPLGGVRGRRRFLRIKSAVLIRNFMSSEDRLLGTATDKVIGKQLNRHPATVAQRRRALGITSFRQRRAFTE